MMNLDGQNKQIFASGLRNPVGLDFHPTTNQLYTTVNERDGLGDDLVPDYLTRFVKASFTASFTLILSRICSTRATPEMAIAIDLI